MVTDDRLDTGAAGGSEEGDGQQQQATTGRRQQRVNVFEYPEVREWQANKDKETAAERNARLAAEKRAQEAEERLRQAEFRASLAGKDQFEQQTAVAQFLQQENARLRQQIEQQAQQFQGQLTAAQQAQEQRDAFAGALVRMGVPRDAIDMSSAKAALTSAKTWLVENEGHDDGDIDASDLEKLYGTYLTAVKKKTKAAADGEPQKRKPPVDTGGGAATGSKASRIKALKDEYKTLRGSGNWKRAGQIERELRELQEAG